HPRDQGTGWHHHRPGSVRRPAPRHAVERVADGLRRPQAASGPDRAHDREPGADPEVPGDCPVTDDVVGDHPAHDGDGNLDIPAQSLPHRRDAATSTRSLRVWSAGCSSGEEPYTVAILIAEALGQRARDFDVKIYATDVDEDALSTGRAGLYRLEQLKDVPED